MRAAGWRGRVLQPTQRLTVGLALAVAAVLGLGPGLAGCGDDGKDAEEGSGRPPDAGADAGPDGDAGGGGVGGIFAAGCPEPGRALARRLGPGSSGIAGPAAAAGAGDYLLLSTQAAFVVQGPEQSRSFFFGGGVVLDALAVDGCRQQGQERLGELGFALVQPDLDDLARSRLRGVTATTAEIVDDGSTGGPAHVRVRGTDAPFALADTYLSRLVYRNGGVRPWSGPLDLEVTLDYLLPPESRVLTVTVTVANRGAVPQAVAAGALVIFDPASPTARFARTTLTPGGFPLEVGLPWLAASRGDGAWAVAAQGELPTATSYTGVVAVTDLSRLLTPPRLAPAAPAGANGGTASFTYWLAAGDGDLNSATRHLHAANPRGFDGTPRGQRAFGGRVHRTRDRQQPLAGALLEVQRRDDAGSWRTFDGFVSDGQGEFGGLLPDFPGPLRLVAHREGLPDPAPAVFVLEDTPRLDVGFDDGGRLAYRVHDGQGQELPARITLWQGEQRVLDIRTTDRPGERELPPGDYGVSVSRGYEYEPYQGTLSIQAGQTTRLDVALAQVVDTSGYLSFDAHMHAAPSPDGELSIAERILAAAVEGLEVTVATDHEYIGTWAAGAVQTGLGRWVATVAGEEVTASLPEHVNIYPVPLRPARPRGDPIDWYGMDLPGIFAAARARGAALVQLNHPREDCGWMCLIRYDRLRGEAALADPTLLGFPAGAALWSFDFDVFEYMNGHDDVFLRPDDPDGTGKLDDWLSFLNLGHRITAVGNTDAHGWRMGSPRSYFASSTDSPADFDEAGFVRAVREGRVLVSAGAFARVTADGSAEPGDTVVDTDGTVDLAVQIEALPGIDVTHFKVLVNCDEALTVATTDPHGLVKYDGVVAVPVEQDAHLVVLGFGAQAQPRGLYLGPSPRVPRFTTNAIYVDAGGDGVHDPPGGKPCRYSLDGPRRGP